ncbi:hypothetical protein VTG60DRAFT_341 [Thermothelomyces hinnuleus]
MEKKMWWIESNPRKPIGSCSSLLGSSPIGAGSLRNEPRAHYHMTTAGPATYAYGLSDLNSAGSGPRNKNNNNNDDKEEDGEEAARGFSSRVQNPTTKLTGAQLTYLFVMQALPSMLIAGALNFAVAYRKSIPPPPPPPPPHTTQKPNQTGRTR